MRRRASRRGCWAVRRAIDTYPDPVDHCRVCVWYPTCIQRRRDDDHPSIVAGMRRVDTERFLDGGVPTLTAIAQLPTDAVVRRHRSTRSCDGSATRRGSSSTSVGLRSGSSSSSRPSPDGAGRGLAALPEPTPWDVFFDIEADPWALDGGLEYLLGVGDRGRRRADVPPVLGRTTARRRRRRSRRFIDFFIERLDAHPDMHVYHYGGYESGAIKRLMQRHATREDEVDRLLRGGVFVDLLNVVRQGVRASVESYSLKQIEKFYLPQREGPVTEAGFSVVEYERWMARAGRLDPQGHRRLQPRRLRLDADASRPGSRTVERRPSTDSPRRSGSDQPSATGRPAKARPRAPAEVQERIDALTRRGARRPRPAQPRAARRAGCWLRCSTGIVAMRSRPGGCGTTCARSPRRTSSRRARASAGCVTWRMSAPPRGASFGATPSLRRTTSSAGARRSSTRTRADGSDFGIGAGDIVEIDDVHGTIDLKRGPSMLGYHPTSLIPTKPIGAGPMPSALLRIADHVIAQRDRGRRTVPSRTRPAHSPPATSRRRRGGNTAGPDRRGPRRGCPADRGRAGGHRAADPGPAGNRQDVHGRPDDRGAHPRAVDASVWPPSRTRRSRNMLEAVSEAAVDAGVPLRAHPEVRHGRRARATIQAFGWPPTTRRSRPASGTADSTWPQGPSGCSPARRWSRRSTCCSSTRPGRCRWPTSSR